MVLAAVAVVGVSDGGMCDNGRGAFQTGACWLASGMQHVLCWLCHRSCVGVPSVMDKGILQGLVVACT